MRSSISRLELVRGTVKNEPSGLLGPVPPRYGIMNLPRARAIFCGRGIIIMVLLLKILLRLVSCAAFARALITLDSPVTHPSHLSTAIPLPPLLNHITVCGSVVAFSSSFNDDARGAQTGSGGPRLGSRKKNTIQCVT